AADRGLVLARPRVLHLRVLATAIGAPHSGSSPRKDTAPRTRESHGPSRADQRRAAPWSQARSAEGAAGVAPTAFGARAMRAMMQWERRWSVHRERRRRLPRLQPSWR